MDEEKRIVWEKLKDKKIGKIGNGKVDKRKKEGSGVER